MQKAIIFIIALSLPLGDQLNIIGIDVSLIYVFSIALATIYLPFIKCKYNIPIAYQLFYLYALSHIIITYLPRLDLLSESLQIRVYNKVVSNETYGNMILRYIIYLLSPCVIMKYINNIKLFVCFAKVFIYSLLVSVIIGTIFEIVISSDNRLLGGFHDPNTFGGMSLIALFLSFYLSKCKYAGYRCLSFVFIVLIIASGSRSAIISLSVGLLYIFYRYGLSYKNFAFVGVMIIAVLFIVQSDFYIVERFKGISSSNVGDLRMVIWEEYIKNWGQYFFNGVGVGFIFDVVKDLDSMRGTHNQYLLQLVQFGIIGLLLFLGCIYKNIRFFTKYSKINKALIPIASLQLCSLILLFFSDYDNTRELVLLTTLYFIFYNLRKNSATSISLTRKAQSYNDF